MPDMPSQLKSLFGTMRRKPSHSPDGKTDQEAAGTPSTEKTSITHDITHLNLKQAKTVTQAIGTLASGEPMDDKELLLEHGVAMLQSLPVNSGLSQTVSNSFIGMLWNDLPHPPPTAAGPTARYRQHDGSGNNLWVPEMGRAGSPYSRSVPPTKSKGPNLPDPELVYDQLLRRNGPFRPHPSGLNRLFFSFATVVIHECFQTSRTNPWVNETSSYVDLSTLYGNTEKEQKRVRTYENGTIFPDSVASERIMMMPPGVVTVVIMFSRNHNQIARDILSINEDGKYKPWDTLSDEKKKWQDEDIFQISRNINVGFFASVVLHDYVAAILNTPRANSQWSLDLGAEIKQSGQRLERGTGNVVSVEFAVLYHWHAALSAADATWMDEILKKYLPELKSVDDVTPEMFSKVMMNYGHSFKATPAKEWTFGGLKRDADGKFSDTDLGELMKDCIEEPAHAFGAHGTPASMKIVEVLGQLQARETFNVCTMNEFRRYLALKPYESFEDWNPDKETARAAELLYGHIENLELYPGLMAEVTKPPVAGSGVCPGQTTGRGILDDAVALVRGDRFLSYDFNSTTLTNWGFAKLGALPPGAYGGMLPNLLFNGLPGAWTGTSTYALLPFYTPAASKEIVTKNKVADQYDLARPLSGQDVIGIHTQQGCVNVFEDRENFSVIYQKAIPGINGQDFIIGWDDAARHNSRSDTLHKAFFEEGFDVNVTQFFRTHVAKQVKEQSLKYTSSTRRTIDIVRDVTNIVPILWLAERFAIPLKTKEHPRGLLSIYETFSAFLVLFLYQSFNIVPANEWTLRDGAATAAKGLKNIFEAHLKSQQGIKEHIVDWLAKGSAFEVGPDADRLYHALIATKLPLGDLVSDILGLAVPVAGNITQQASLLIDLFLSEGYEDCKERIVELAHKDDPVSEKELQGFVFEGIRHAGAVPGLPRVATRDVTVIDGARGPVEVKAGSTVLIATSSAAMDPVAFPNPEKLDPHRPLSAYATLLGHHSFGTTLLGSSLASTLKEVFKLKNLRRAPGKHGQLYVVENTLAGVTVKKYLDSNAKESSFPTSLTLEYDEE